MSATIQKLPKESTQWTWNTEEQYLGNPNFGKIQLVAVCDEEGNVRYEQPIFLQQLGEFYIVVNEDARIGIIRTQRHAVIPIENYHTNWGTWRPPKGSTEMLIPHPTDLHQSGEILLELPRGLALSKLQEAAEEIGLQVTEIADLGNLNSDPAFYGTSPSVYVCMASKLPSEIPPDPNERILEILWLKPEEAREVKTLSMPYYATLFLFRRWALKQEDTFWRTIGTKL